jgi:hypothetical protein
VSKKKMYNMTQRKEAGAGDADALAGSQAFLNETDALLPVQLYGTRRGGAAVQSLKRLMMAILADAIHCYQRNVDAVTLPKRREFREARDWLFNQRDNGPFSFDTVCYVLATDPGLLRKRLIQLQHARAASAGR